MLYPPDIGRLLSPRSAPPAPSADSKEGKEMVKKVETDLQNLPVTKEYRKLTGWYECRESELFLSLSQLHDAAGFARALAFHRVSDR